MERASLEDALFVAKADCAHPTEVVHPEQKIKIVQQTNRKSVAAGFFALFGVVAFNNHAPPAIGFNVGKTTKYADWFRSLLARN